jgi:hypothetical protein
MKFRLVKGEDVILAEILKDGTTKLISDPVSMPNHSSATNLFKTVATLSGGDVETTKRKDVHHHHHHSDEEEELEKETQ